MRLSKIPYWRIVEPILLGSIANILINYIFKPNNPDFILEEFIVAIAFAAVVTEVNRFIDLKLEGKFSWTVNFKRRFLYQLSYLTLSLLIILNVIGNLYIWVIGDDFYSWQELLIINLSVFAVALLLTFSKWSVRFYQNWKEAEYHLQSSETELHELKSELEKSAQTIVLQKGNSVLKIPVEQMKFAISKWGIVWVYYDETKAVYNGPLTSLEELLPRHLYFQAARNAVIRKDRIASVSPLSYGKVRVRIKDVEEEDSTIIISRLKAASFRKWYHSTSV